MREKLRKILHDIVMFIAPQYVKRRMGSCNDISQYICTQPKLNMADKVFFNMHIIICKRCVEYKTQIIKLDKYTQNELRKKLEKQSSADDIKIKNITESVKKTLLK